MVNRTRSIKGSNLIAVSASRPVSPIKWHGGKHYLAKRIVALMPPHLHYVEPYAGGLSVLFAKDPEGVSEVVSDLNGDLTNFWRALQGTDSFAAFRRVFEAVPFSEPEWQDACAGLRDHPDADPVQRAIWFFIVCRSLAKRGDLIPMKLSTASVPMPGKEVRR
jgi:D12 class N6 adenine-specific DNA methyltransferase